MRRNQTWADLHTARAMRHTVLHALRAARAASPPPAQPSFPEPADPLLLWLPRDCQAILQASYRPVELLTKRWIAACPAPTTQHLRLHLYRAIIEVYRNCWPQWPSNPYPASFWPCAGDLMGCGVVAVATIGWAETVDQELMPGILALTVLATDLAAAHKRNGRVAAGTASMRLWDP